MVHVTVWILGVWLTPRTGLLWTIQKTVPRTGVTASVSSPSIKAICFLLNSCPGGTTTRWFSVGKSLRFSQVHDGVPYYETQGVNHEQCCDCGLVHRVKYVVHDARGKPVKGAKVHLTVWRSPRYTAQARKARGIRPPSK